MNEINIRLVNPGQPPTPAQLKAWMGKKAYVFWVRISEWIGQKYLNVFTPEWLFGGKKHGWFLRYKKSKSFCSLIPEKGHFAILIVFGAKERDQVETICSMLSVPTQQAYNEATTYHDGKWLLLHVGSERVFGDVQRLLAVKRKFKD